MRSFLSSKLAQDADFARIHQQHLQLPPEEHVEKQYWIHQIDANGQTADRDGPFSDFSSTGFPAEFTSNAQEYLSIGVVEIEVRDNNGELIRLTNGGNASLDLRDHAQPGLPS